MTDWKTDAEAGTPGPWRQFAKTRVLREKQAQYPDDRTGTVEICECGNMRDEDLVPFNAERWMSDARRISRVPAYEEALRAAEAMAAFVEHNHPESISLIAFRKAMKKL